MASPLVQGITGALGPGISGGCIVKNRLSTPDPWSSEKKAPNSVNLRDLGSVVITGPARCRSCN